MKLRLPGALAALILLQMPVAATPAAGQSAPSFAACLDFDRAACDATLAAEPDNLTALFIRGLAAELAGDHRAALADFTDAATREPRHFGAQLWRYVAAATLDTADDDTFAAYLKQSQLPPWPKVLGELYLGTANAATVVALAEAQPAPSRAEALCAAHYHIGRAAFLTGDIPTAETAFRAAVATGATRVFEYRAAERALQGNP
jgi:lipoprotein NlpI